MLYPELKPLKQYIYPGRVFGGYVHTVAADENSFYDMENISSDSYPLLEARAPRSSWHRTFYDAYNKKTDEKDSFILSGKGLTGAAAFNSSICFSSETALYVDGRVIEGVKLESGYKNKSIVPFGRNIFIAPDGLYLVDNDPGYSVRYAQKYLFSGDEKISFSFCSETGETESPGSINAFPAAPSDGDTASGDVRQECHLFRYSAPDKKWIDLRRLYMKLSMQGIEEGFEPGDMLHIEGNVHKGFKEKVPLSTSRVIKTGKDFIVLDGILHAVFSDINVGLDKRMPMLDFAVEHNNRVWGCRYGRNENGEEVNEIYASAAGDPCAWYRFEGISTDSYMASLGAGGAFTGACVQGNDVLFFKEDYIIRVSGSTPEDFTVSTLRARGVQKGCHRSIVTLNEKVFYKSSSGVMVYDGTQPYKISDDLGSEKYSEACAGGIDGKYYISMKNAGGESSLFVYNTASGLWHREDADTEIAAFAGFDGCLYFICATGSFDYMMFHYIRYEIFAHNAACAPPALTEETAEGSECTEFIPCKKPSWYAVTGLCGEISSPSDAVIRKIILNLSLEEDSVFSLYIKPEGEEKWQRICFIDSPHRGSFSVPAITPPCHSYVLKFEGRGGCTVRAVTKCLERAGEVRRYG